MAVQFERLDRGSSVVYGACSGIWVMTLFATPTRTDMLLAAGTLQAMSQREPSGFPTLTWVLPEAGFRMENDARDAAAKVTRDFDQAIAAQATLIEGSGFQAAAVRAIISGLDVMSRSSGPKKVFSSLEPAVSWCLTRRPSAPAAPGASPLATETSATLQAMRAGIFAV